MRHVYVLSTYSGGEAPEIAVFTDRILAVERLEELLSYPDDVPGEEHLAAIESWDAESGERLFFAIGQDDFMLELRRVELDA